ncbi:MAG TPA: HEAT repeat domain-containing protein [Planctomycetota bacterium]
MPLVEIQDGGAARHGERVVCRACRSVLREALPARGGGSGMLVPLVVGLLGWAAAGFVWLHGDDAHRQFSVDLQTEYSRLDNRVGSQGEALAALADRATEDSGLLDNRLAALRDEQERSSRTAEQRFGPLETGLAALDGLVPEFEALRARVDRSEANLSVIEDRQRAFRATQENLRDQLTMVQDGVRRAAVAAPDEGSAAAPEFSPEVVSLLRQLQHEDGRERYRALEKLAELQDERLLPHLYPLLADPYEFMRFLAAHTLGQWEAKAAVPHLIEALLDEKPFVREAAIWSLRRLSKQDFGFDYTAPRDELVRAYEAWKTWWSANGEEFLRSSS